MLTVARKKVAPLAARLVTFLRHRFRNTWVQRLPFATPLYRLVFRATTTGELAKVEFRGISLELPTDDVTMVPSLMAGDYESFELDIFELLLEPGHVVFDVGGNIGVYALIAARQLERGHVYSFEPVPANLEMFARNIELAGSASTLTVVEKAVGDTVGTIAIGVDGPNIGTHSVANADAEGAIEVDTITLDGFADEHGVTPDLIKIDVEGFEPSVVAGAKRILAGKPTLMIEFTPRLIRDCGFDPAQLAGTLLDAYGSAFVIDERARRLVKHHDATSIMRAVERATSTNLLLIADDTDVRLQPLVA